MMKARGGRTDIRLVALDFDLTLYDHAAPRRTRELSIWFARLHRAGVLVGLASGRSVEELFAPLSEIHLPWAQPFPHFVICNEGSIMTPACRDWPGAEAWNAHRRDRVLTANGFLRSNFEFLDRWAKSQAIPITRQIVESEAGINIVLDTPANAQRGLDELKKRLAGKSEYHLSRNHHIILALPHGTEKGAAVAQLAGLCGISSHQVLVIGDNLNDWSMFCETRGFLPASPSNADPQVIDYVKKRGGIVADAPISAGVASIFTEVFGKLPRIATTEKV